MNRYTSVIILLGLILWIPAISQNKTLTNLKEAYRIESSNQQLFAGFADQADQEAQPRIALFFRAISKVAAIHAENFAKILTKSGIGISPIKVTVINRPDNLNLDDALYSVRIAAAETYPSFMDQARSDEAKDALKAFRWAKETQQQSLQMYVDASSALAKAHTASLPSVYLICPKCGNLYNSPETEKECSFCFTERDKFIRIR